jgi:hypothetical protein
MPHPFSESEKLVPKPDAEETRIAHHNQIQQHPQYSMALGNLNLEVEAKVNHSGNAICAVDLTRFRGHLTVY